MATLLLHLGDEKFRNDALSVENRQAIDDALADGHGAVIAGLHIGPHLALPLTLAQLGYDIGVIGAPPVLALGQRFSAACLPDAARRITWLPTGDPASLVRARALLRSGTLVMGFVDQVVARGAKTLDVTMFGRTISTSVVLARLAALAGSPIVPAYMTRMAGPSLWLELCGRATAACARPIRDRGHAASAVRHRRSAHPGAPGAVAGLGAVGVGRRQRCHTDSGSCSRILSIAGSRYVA